MIHKLVAISAGPRGACKGPRCAPRLASTSTEPRDRSVRGPSHPRFAFPCFWLLPPCQMQLVNEPLAVLKVHKVLSFEYIFCPQTVCFCTLRSTNFFLYDCSVCFLFREFIPFQDPKSIYFDNFIPLFFVIISVIRNLSPSKK